MKIIYTLILLALSLNTFASTWSKTISVDYQLGDGDSKSTARELALQQIKLTASSKAGTYIQSNTTLNNNNLNEHIEVISASLIKLSNIKEVLQAKGKSFILKVSAVATIDESELRSRIRAIQSDKEKANQIAKLEVENQMLVNELSKVKYLLAKDNLNTQQVTSILKRQTNLIQNFKSNAHAVSQVFSRGTLLQIARKNKAKFNQIISKLETEFFGPMLEAKVIANVDVIEENGQYAALVSVSWTMPQNIKLSTLKKHLDSHSFKASRGYIDFSSYNNLGTDAKTSQTEALFNYLSKQKVKAVVTLGSKTIAIPMLWSEKHDSFRTCQTERNYGKFTMKYGRICFLTKQSMSDDLRAYKTKENPIKIYLTEKELESITSINTSVRRL